MSVSDILIIIAILIAVFLAARSIYRRRKTGSCGTCSGCAYREGCSKAGKDEQS
ncbi:MAG: FeoB-associated Cys-rich membrane protein [Eubacterium sp.]|nr:FeoB-associated Cys-rich membrane protein [Eubacterium sp.]